MEQVAVPITAGWSLDAVVARLSAHEAVTGLLQIGSLAEGALTAASDYDLVIVLREAPQPWYVGVTQIGGRFADLIFVAAAEAARVGALTEPIGSDHQLAPVARWLNHGRIIFDRSGQLQQAQQHLRRGNWLRPTDDAAAYGAWFAINYNLAQARRMVRAADSLYRTTVQIRMAVYGSADLWFGYFTMRQLPFEGDKTAVSYLLRHDRTFLQLYRQFIAETDVDQKLVRYAEAAAQATAPLGGLWPADATVMNVPETLEAWQRLLA